MIEPNTNQSDDLSAPEANEPTAGGFPVPPWLWVLTVAIVFWAGMYLAYNSGGFRADVFNSGQVSWEGGTSGPVAPPDPKAVGKRVFTKNCVVCHQSNGEGVAGQFPPLTGSEWVLSQGWHGDNQLVRVVLDGLQGAVQVRGATFNNAMVSWKKQLSDDQIASVLTYIRSEWGNDAPPITPEYVASIRKETEDRKEPWTQKELEAIPRQLISESGAAPESAPAEEAAGEAPAPGGA